MPRSQRIARPMRPVPAMCFGATGVIGLESLRATGFNFAQHRAQVIAHLADFLIALLWIL